MICDSQVTGVTGYKILAPTALESRNVDRATSILVFIHFISQAERTICSLDQPAECTFNY